MAEKKAPPHIVEAAAGIKKAKTSAKKTAAKKRTPAKKTKAPAPRKKAAARIDLPPPSRDGRLAELADAAAPIVSSENVLDLFEGVWRRVVAREERLGKLLFLAGVSRLFPKAIHVAVKGPSSGGKSEVRKRVLNFFPPEAVVHFTSMSERALIYFEGDFRHKILSMGEAAGSDEQSLQDYLLRELMSEGVLHYQVVQMHGSVGSTVTITKHGPVAFMVTTTRHKLHPENETRMLSLDIDDSEDQTRAVLGKVALLEGVGDVSGRIDFQPWQNFQRWLALGNREVAVPYALQLAAAIPPRSVRLRRDLGHVLRAIRAHALIHREHRELNAHGAIVADIARDYAVVRELMHDVLAETAETKIKETTFETIEVVRHLTEGLDEDEGVTAAAVGKELRLDKSSAYRRLVVATDGGFVINLESRPGRPGKFRLTDEQVEAIEIMPTAAGLEMLAAPLTPRATAQPANPERIDQLNQQTGGCAPGCTPSCNQSPDEAVANPSATERATDETPGKLPKSEGGVQGCTGAEQMDGDGLDHGDRAEREATENEPDPEAEPEDPEDLHLPWNN
jgi:hypothetical protein